MPLEELSALIRGEVRSDKLSQAVYATDASIYKEYPLGVVYPRDELDLVTIVNFCRHRNIALIPRTAGTSLAGQCVGNGLVVDVSRHMTGILEINEEEKWVRVQPGVIRDELNRLLKSYDLMFGPNTATANRCMLGGMVGNNSCGSTSIVYGATRDHVLAVRAVLSDGSVTVFNSCSAEKIQRLSQQSDLEGIIYRQIIMLLQDEGVQKNIRDHYPKATIRRRNNGYAIDTLIHMHPFQRQGDPLNLAKLLAGSEGTLALFSEITLNLVPCPPPGTAMLAVHFRTIKEALVAVPTIMQFEPFACELMDKIILDCTRAHHQYAQDRSFVEGDPAGILLVECRALNDHEAILAGEHIMKALQASGQGYAWPVLCGPQVTRAWALRQAGLGLLANLPGEKKAVACIEDTAVDIRDLADYIQEVQDLMASVHQESIYYAHAGDGELHLRPVLNLRDPDDVKLLRTISESSAALVKKYQGSLAGEHGIGRVRGEFLKDFIGQQNYDYLKQIKQTWDPHHIFNPGKIIDAPPMDSSLRVQPVQNLDTLFRFEETHGFLGAVERCTGSGDCRKLPEAGGGLCPSYQATRNERDTTRARANALREFVSNSAYAENAWNHPELEEVLDLCLSCKACKHECPSSVDMATLKAEWQYQYYRHNRRPWSHYLWAKSSTWQKLATIRPKWTNALLYGPGGDLLKSMFGLANERPWPQWSSQSWTKWFNQNKSHYPLQQHTRVILFADEFTNYFDAEVGIAATKLLRTLGYAVQLWRGNSGRALISKGFLPAARALAHRNINDIAPLLTPDTVLVGIEPSAMLSFRDEYPRLVNGIDSAKITNLQNNSLLIEEFLGREIRNGAITRDRFHEEEVRLVYHGHCHQKALTDLQDVMTCLSLPLNHHVEVIPSGCCGLAGSFGYEQEHYDLSMAIGEMVLFPAVRNAGLSKWVVASGTSCRHQILHGTGRRAVHPVEVLYKALK